MGKFSPYSEEWERQRIKKTLDQMAMEYQRKKAAFNRLPRPIQALVRAGQSVSYYLPIFRIYLRKKVDRQYHQEMAAGVKQIKKLVEMVAKTPHPPQEDQASQASAQPPQSARSAPHQPQEEGQ